MPVMSRQRFKVQNPSTAEPLREISAYWREMFVTLRSQHLLPFHQPHTNLKNVLLETSLNILLRLHAPETRKMVSSNFEHQTTVFSVHSNQKEKKSSQHPKNVLKTRTDDDQKTLKRSSWPLDLTEPKLYLKI